MLYMNRNKKGLHRVTANVLSLTLASVMAAGAAGEAVSSVSVYAAETSQAETSASGSSIYLNGTLPGDSKGDGTTKEKAVATIDQALKLAGSQGTILVCGPVTINSEKKLTIPSGVQFKRAQDYTGALIKITGKGKLTLTGGSLQAEDVDTSDAELGEGAFVREKVSQTKKEGQVTMTSQVTLASPEIWNSFDFGGAGFAGEGTFAWASQTAPEQYQSEVQVVFTPKDTQNYDYSKVPGWDSGRGTVVRSVTVTIESLKPAEPEDKGENVSTNPDSLNPPDSEQTGPEQPGGNQNGQNQEGQNPQQPEAAEVTIPQEIKLSKPEDVKNFDFAKAGFLGEGTFAWETDALPDAYETQRNVVFTPSDTENKDYSQAEGWEAEKKQVVRTVKVLTEQLKEENAGSAEENPDKDQSNTESEGNQTSQKDTEEDKKDSESDSPSQDEPKEETDTEDTENAEESKDSEKTPVQVDEDFVQAKPGKEGEVAQELPEVIPVGSLIDENSGVRVEGDFLPYYVDLQVSYNQDLSQLPDAGIGEILSAYEIKLWDLKEDEEYKIPDGKKVRVMIPLPENAGSFSEISIAHYLGNSEYEYYNFPSEEYPGNLAVINIEGMEYLTFETSSFSPFNVGGSQLVGPGTQISQGGSSSGQNSGGSSSQGGSSASNSAGTSAGNTHTNSSSQSVIQPSANSGSQTNANSQSSNTGNRMNPSRLTRVVKTGDEAPVFLYGAAGAAAALLGAVSFFKGKKKRS